MRIPTREYGEIDVEERQLITLPWGLLGFEDLHRWALLDPEQPTFRWYRLQSLERPEIAFVLIDPRLIRPDYEPGVEPAELAGLELAAGDEPVVFAIVTIPADVKRMTMNLQGPLLINPRTRVGRQAVSADPRWGVRHVIADELCARRTPAC